MRHRRHSRTRAASLAHDTLSAISIALFDQHLTTVQSPLSWGVNVVRLPGPVARNLMEGWMRLGTPVMFVSHFHPFVHLEYDALMDCVINTYKSVDITGERVVRGITGEAPFTGKL